MLDISIPQGRGDSNKSITALLDMAIPSLIATLKVTIQLPISQPIWPFHSLRSLLLKLPVELAHPARRDRFVAHSVHGLDQIVVAAARISDQAGILI